MDLNTLPIIEDSPAHPTILIGLQIYRTAFLASHVSKNTKLIFICGGSDVNEDVKCAQKLKQMSKAISKSSAVVTFSESLRRRFLQFWPNYQGILRIIPQSVLVNRFDAVDIKGVIAMVESQLDTRLDNFILLVGRLRPLKDPNYILQPFLEVVQNMPTRHLHLLYIGSIEEDCEEIQSFLSEVDKHKCMHWMESLPQSQVHALMTVAICLVNASLSEGQALTIMEAMALGCPVVARNIPANTDLIQHNETGLIFNSPTELKACLESLLVNEDLYRSISSKAADKMRQQEFQLHTEAMAYLKLVKDIQMMES